MTWLLFEKEWPVLCEPCLASQKGPICRLCFDISLSCFPSLWWLFRTISVCKKTRFKVPCISFWPPIQFFLERKWSSMLVLLYSVNALPYTPSCQVEIPQKFVPWRWIPTPSHPSAKYLLLFKLDSQFSWDCGSESTY